MNTFLNIKEGEETYTYMPFNEFTTTELGLDRGNNICPMVVGMPGHSSTDMFLKNFAELWKDKEKFQDVTDNVIENIETVYKENAPAFIYFITLYNIFNEFLEDISEDVLPNEATGFKSSVIWNKLYNFQRDASLAIINKLEKYNGCILADSVGLGKTFTALSVIKYYENRNRNVLVLCPKKLNDNWQTFRSNYKNNPVLADRLRYDILFHSDLSRDKGLSNGLDLERVNWGNYDLDLLNEIDNEIYDFIYRNNLGNTPGAEELLNDGKYFNDDKVLTHAMLSFMNDEIIEQIVDALSDNIWIYNYSPNGDFFTCDNPIHITPHYKGEVNHTLLGLNQYGAEVSWPINPYFTLSIYDRNYFPQKECNDNSIIYCSEEDINHYNIIRYGCAKDFVFSKSKNFTTAERCFMINNIFNLQ